MPKKTDRLAEALKRLARTEKDIARIDRVLNVLSRDYAKALKEINRIEDYCNRLHDYLEVKEKESVSLLELSPRNDRMFSERLRLERKRVKNREHEKYVS